MAAAAEYDGGKSTRGRGRSKGARLDEGTAVDRAGSGAAVAALDAARGWDVPWASRSRMPDHPSRTRADWRAECSSLFGRRWILALEEEEAKTSNKMVSAWIYYSKSAPLLWQYG